MSKLDIPGLISLLQSGKTNDALEIATQLVREMPMLVTAHVVRARALESQEEFDEALSAWRNALDLVPNSPVVRKGLRRTAAKLMNASRRTPAADDTRGDRGTGSARATDRESSSPDLSVETAQTAGRTETGPASFEDLTVDLPPGRERPLPPSAKDDVPGFQSFDSMFDVEPEFEQRLAEDYRRQAQVDPDEDRERLRLSDFAESTGPSFEDTGGSSFGDAPPEFVLGHDDGGNEEDDLDGLIAELEDARIMPSDRAFPQPDLESRIEDVASETLARIYAEQKQFEEAARVYARLADISPDNRQRFLKRASEMKDLAGRS